MEDTLILEDNFVSEILNMEDYEKEAVREFHINWKEGVGRPRVNDFEVQFIIRYEKTVLAKITDLNSKLYYHVIYSIRS